MSYTITLKSYSGGTAILTLTSTSTISTAFLIRARAYSDSAGTQYVDGSGWVAPPSSSTEMDFTLSIANPGTYYVTVESDEPETILSLEPVVLPDNTPKTATQSQWEDLATRVKSKADSSSVPVITMSATDPGEGSPLTANNYVAVYGQDPIILDYSTNEINTGVKWIDGSTIYKKTINVGTLPNNTTNLVNHNISNIGTIIEIKGTAYESSTTNTIPLPYVGDTLNATVKIFTTSSVINIWAGTDRSGYSGYITLYYTKSA